MLDLARRLTGLTARRRAEGIEVDSSPGNPFGIARSAHCVLTVDLVDTPGHPTKEALDRTIEFIGEQLRPGPAAGTGTETGTGGQ